MPKGIFPYTPMASAWAPWSESPPGEWKNFCASGGKYPKRKIDDQIRAEVEHPLANPEAMAAGSGVLTRVITNDSFAGRRQTLAAVEEEAILAGKTQKENEEKQTLIKVKGLMQAQKKGVAAMVDANANAKQVAGEMKRMVMPK